MTRPKRVHDLRIVLTALIGIAYQQAYGRACGFAFKHTRQDFHGIGFFTLGNVPRGTWFTSV